MASLWPSWGNKSNWRNIWAKKYFMSFLLHYCLTFLVTVIPCGLLSSLLNYRHYHFKYVSSWIAPVPSHTAYTKGEKIGQQSRPYLRVYLNWRWIEFDLKFQNHRTPFSNSASTLHNKNYVVEIWNRFCSVSKSLCRHREGTRPYLNHLRGHR